MTLVAGQFWNPATENRADISSPSSEMLQSSDNKVPALGAATPLGSPFSIESSLSRTVRDLGAIKTISL